MPDQILFYSVGDEYGEFSNFAAYPISLDGKRWPTSEHYFQAQKFLEASCRSRSADRRRPGKPPTSAVAEKRRFVAIGNR